jgi:hypothetical protein
MSGLTFDHYSHDLSNRSKSYNSDKESYFITRKSVVEDARKNVEVNAAKPKIKRETLDLYDEKLVKMTITKPQTDTQRVHIVLIDLPTIPSGSQEIVYLGAMLQLGLSIQWDKLIQESTDTDRKKHQQW